MATHSRRLLASLATVSAMSLALAGCGSTGNETAAEGNKEPIEIT